jgi:hypothetical protein
MQLLGGTVALYAAVIAFGGTPLGVATRLLLLVFLLAVVARWDAGQWIRFVLVGCGAAAVILATVAWLFGSQRLSYAAVGFGSAVVILATITSLARTLVRRGVVDTTSVANVLCVYLLLAQLFAGVHQLLGAFIVPYLQGTGHPASPSDLLYFSVITLTTVGFGDITPGSSAAKAVVVVEALSGQLYLVSVVAAAVAGALAHRQVSAPPDGKPDEQPGK